MKGAMRILLLADSPRRASLIERALVDAGSRVLGSTASPDALPRAVETHDPDVIVIDHQARTDDVLEHVSGVTRTRPRPVVMFTDDGSEDSIRRAVAAGVSAYVVEGLDTGRLKSIIDVAVARFEVHHALVKELADAQEKLADRKLIEQAKGILMKSRGLTEADAYHAIRKTAMERGQRVGEVARQLVDISGLLG
jgi:response regulator NasT